MLYWMIYQDRLAWRLDAQNAKGASGGMEDIMSQIGDLEEALYYQYLINHNSSSTMLNAVSGSSSDDGGFSALSALGGIAGLGDTGSLYGLGEDLLGNIGSVSGFSDILESYMAQDDETSAVSAAEMADKLSGVLEEAAQTENTSSLTYQTVQEIYEYFKDQVSAKAASLLGTETAEDKTDKAASAASANQLPDAEEEIDFSQYDEVVESAFAEVLPGF